MSRALWIVLVVGGLLLLTRKAKASTGTGIQYPTGGGTGRTATRPAAGGMEWNGPVPSYGAVHPMDRAEVEKGWADARSQIDPDFNGGAALYAAHPEDFDAYPVPLPPTIIAVIMSRESGGQDVNSTIGEKGYMQLSDAEIQTAGGGDPHDRRDSIRMAQRLYNIALERHPQENAEDELFIALCFRSIGGGALRWLLSRIPKGDTRLTDRVMYWLTNTPERPVGIHQSDRKFTLRIARALLRAERAEQETLIASDEGGLPRLG